MNIVRIIHTMLRSINRLISAPRKFARLQVLGKSSRGYSSDSRILNNDRIMRNIMYNSKHFEKLKKNMEVTDEMLADVIDYDSLLIRELPEDKIIQNLCDIAVRGDPELINVIPLKFVHQEMVNDAFAKDPHIIESIPLEFMTQEICNKSFKFDNRNYKYIPENFITQKMSNKVFKSGLWTLFPVIPKEHLTKEMCINLLDEIHHHNGIYLFNDDVFCQLKEDIIRENIIKDIPTQFIDFQLAKKIFIRYPNLLHLIPAIHIKQELFEESHCIYYMPQEYITLEMCQKYITDRLSDSSNLNVLNSIPVKYFEQILEWLSDKTIVGNLEEVILPGYLFKKYFSQKFVMNTKYPEEIFEKVRRNDFNYETDRNHIDVLDKTKYWYNFVTIPDNNKKQKILRSYYQYNVTIPDDCNIQIMKDHFLADKLIISNEKYIE